MRTYGRTVDVLSGKKTWWRVNTDENGFNDSVYVTALAQVIKLNLGESPFFADWGIPAHESVVTQVYPDLFIVRIQQRFSPFFASLVLTIAPIRQGSPESFAADQDGAPAPYYIFNALTNSGSIVGVQVRPDYPQEQPI